MGKEKKDLPAYLVVVRGGLIVHKKLLTSTLREFFGKLLFTGPLVVRSKEKW